MADEPPHTDSRTHSTLESTKRSQESRTRVLDGGREDDKDDQRKDDEAPTNEDAGDPSQEGEDIEKADRSAPQHAAISTDIYSTFTVPQKRAIVLVGSFVSWFSPMTGSIYFPALNQIARDLNVSSAKVNITVTTYLVRPVRPPFST